MCNRFFESANADQHKELLRLMAFCNLKEAVGEFLFRYITSGSHGALLLKRFPDLVEECLCAEVEETEKFVEMGLYKEFTDGGKKFLFSFYKAHRHQVYLGAIHKTAVAFLRATDDVVKQTQISESLSKDPSIVSANKSAGIDKATSVQRQIDFERNIDVAGYTSNLLQLLEGTQMEIDTPTDFKGWSDYLLNSAHYSRARVEFQKTVETQPVEWRTQLVEHLCEDPGMLDLLLYAFDRSFWSEVIATRVPSRSLVKLNILLFGRGIDVFGDDVMLKLFYNMEFEAQDPYMQELGSRLSEIRKLKERDYSDPFLQFWQAEYGILYRK